MLKDFLENWKEINQVTLDLINAIPKKYYYEKPFQLRFKSFAWEFSCILSTRMGYIKGLESKELNGKCFEENDEELEKLSKEEMIKKLKQTNLKIIKIINNQNKTINYFGRKTSQYSVISWLLQHEQLHYGKLILYLSKLKIKIPLTLKKMWGKQSFNQKLYKQ